MPECDPMPSACARGWQRVEDLEKTFLDHRAETRAEFAAQRAWLRTIAGGVVLAAILGGLAAARAAVPSASAQIHSHP